MQQVLYATAENIAVLMEDLRDEMAWDDTPEQAEAFIRNAKLTAVTACEDLDYWNRVKIFKVTIEIVEPSPVVEPVECGGLF